MQYLVLSFSHKNADLALREKLSLNDDLIKVFLDYLADFNFIKETIMLSTCNRIEVMMMSDDAYNALQKCFIKLSELSGITKEELEGRANTFEGYSAIHHIFLVASSLDSLVIGETQISGQLKKAYRYSLHSNYCTNKGLGNVIDFAFKCASSVRNETGISKKPISVASTAVASAKSFQLNEKKATVVGLGEMGQLAIKHLLGGGYQVKLLNRNKQKALDFKSELNDDNLIIGNFDDLANEINNTELLFSATASQTPIITNAMIKKTTFQRYFFDLALPRDIEDLEDCSVALILIDDLRNIVDENIGYRKESLNLAYQIVGDQVNEFFKWLNILSVEPIIKTLRQLAKEAAIQETDKAIQKSFIPEEYKKNILKTIHNVFNIFLHTPTKNLKEVASSSQLIEIERTLRMLFDISKKNVKEAEVKHDKDAFEGNK